MFTLENDQLRIAVNLKGAELSSIYNKITQLEYLWSGDPAFWPKKSPVLFPIVGTLKNNTYYYEGKSYQLNRHGFARDMDFTLTDQSDTHLQFTLTDTPETLQKFPFRFQLDIIYTIEGSSLSVTYQVHNPSADNMFFSFGGHPAFKVPLENRLDFEDYYFEFEREETALRWMISLDGLINPAAIPFLKNTKKLKVTRELFRDDAVVMKYLHSNKVTLKTNKSEHGIEFSFPRFPFLGLWTGNNGNFICIEPWCGIADSTTTTQQLINKEGINLLAGESTFTRKWSVRVF